MSLPISEIENKIKYDDESQVLTAIQGTLNENTEAFTLIVEKYTPILYSLAYKMLGFSDETEDVVQEIFIKVFASLDKFRIKSRFLPWIYTIAINYIRSYIKKRNRRLNLVYIDKDNSVELYDNKQKDPSQILANKEAEKLALKALTRLKPEYREVFILRSLEGLSVKEVSVILQIPEGTVKTNLHRAKKKLIKMLTEQDFLKP